MLFGFEFKLNNELYIKTDISKYVKVENKKAYVRLPHEKAKPTVADNSCLKILHTKFNPKLIYRSNVENILEGWKYLESQQIGLEDASSIFAIDEIYTILFKESLPAIPSTIYPAKLAFLVNFLNQEKVKNLEYQIPKIRKKIGNKERGAIRYAIKNLKNGILATTPLKENFASIATEMQICRELVEANFDVSFNIHNKGPDLYLNGKVGLEVTKKIGRLNLQEYDMRMKISHPQDLLTILSPTIVNKIKEEINQGEIVVVDISSVYEGFALLASKHFLKNRDELEFRFAMDQALYITNKGRRAVVFYSCAGDKSAALCADASIIANRIKNMQDI